MNANPTRRPRPRPHRGRRARSRLWRLSYTKDATVVKLGPLEISAKEQERVNVPLCLSIGAIAVGGLLLAVGRRK